MIRPATATAPTVLVVDSSAAARLELRGALHAAGFVVTACDSRGSAVTALRERRFDLVVSDVVLQDGTGIEVVRMLQSARSTANVPVILLASDGCIRERVRWLELPSEAILQKPFTSAELVKRARRLLRLPTSPEPSARAGASGTTSAPGRVTSALARGASPRPMAPMAPVVPLAPLPPPSLAPASAVWRNRTDVPPGSLLHRMAICSGIASVIGPTTVARAFKRAGVDVSASSPSALERALPALRDTLRLFLREADTERRIQKMAELLHAAA
jgi:CheY-like chemotaxis protein